MPLPIDGNYNKVPYESAVQVMFYENTENENYPIHWHTAAEIVMPLEGSYEVHTPAKKLLLQEEDIFIAHSCELHGLSVPAGAEAGRRIILLFEPTLLYTIEELAAAAPFVLRLSLLTPEATPVLHTEARRLLLAALDEFHKRDGYRNTVIYAKIIELYAAMARYCENSKTVDAKTVTMQKECAPRMATLFKYIEDHAAEDITLEDAAAIAHFSKFHFTRIFKEFTNQSFCEYLSQKRIQKVELLLRNPNLSITDIAMRAGFESISTFNRVFKKVKQCTPSEFRRLYYAPKNPKQ